MDNTFSEYRSNHTLDCGICPSPIDGNTAFEFIKDYLMDDEECICTISINGEQYNTVALDHILFKLSPEYRVEVGYGSVFDKIKVFLRRNKRHMARLVREYIDKSKR